MQLLPPEKKMSALVCDCSSVVLLLCQWSTTQCKLPVLRFNWLYVLTFVSFIIYSERNCNHLMLFINTTMICCQLKVANINHMFIDNIYNFSIGCNFSVILSKCLSVILWIQKDAAWNIIHWIPSLRGKLQISCIENRVMLEPGLFRCCEICFFDWGAYGISSWSVLNDNLSHTHLLISACTLTESLLMSTTSP